MRKIDLKYLLAYTGPIVGYLSILFTGAWSFGVVILSFFLIPILDHLIPQSHSHLSKEEKQARDNIKYYDWLLYLNVPIVYGLIVFYLWRVASTPVETWEIIGLTLGIGSILGAFGINVAHELGHRKSAVERTLAQILLMPALYMHWHIEHNRGHHRYVATPEDPSSARYGESIYRFNVRSVRGVWLRAWELEQERLKQAPGAINRMWVYTIVQLIYLLAVYLVFGPIGLMCAMLIGIVAFLELEIINYVEHYGLRRFKTPRGTYEKVSRQHSWESDHEIGRIYLYELSRHAHHHRKASVKYQLLEHSPESPQMPTGLPGMMILCLIPPLFFKLVNSRIPQTMLPASSES